MMLSLNLLRMDRTNTRASRRLRRLVEGITLWLAFLMLLFVQPLYADAATADEGEAGVLRFVDASGRYRQPALVLGSQFDVTVSGMIAQTRLVRRFRNTSDQWQEGVFVFPLPDKASVYDLAMVVGERRIEGKVRPRLAARKEYARAKQTGHQAVNVEQQRPNLFTARIANIPPGETVTVDMAYQQPVQYRNGIFELRLPTTLTPRYMPGPPVEEAQPDQWQSGWALATQVVPDAGAISPYTVTPTDVASDSHRADIDVAIQAGVPLTSITSPSHSLDTRRDGGTVQVSPTGHKVLMDRDFVLRWQPAQGYAPVAAVFHDRFEGEDYLMTMVLPGKTGQTPLPRDLVFVIDTSGSMAGESIRQARSALDRGLATLRAGDRFNVIQFNSQPHALFMEPVAANANNLARAQRYVRNLSADGGTEMASALTLALGSSAGDKETEAGRVRQVVFMTDGAVGNEAALFRQIRAQLGSQRLFTVGIGSAPNQHFMREAAKWGRGTYTSVGDPSDLEGPLKALFAAMSSPVLTDIQTSWPAGAEAYPARPGDLFQGEPLIQVVKGVPASGTLTVSGLSPDGERWSRSLDLQQAAPAQGLHRRWARARIDSLLDQAELANEEPDKAEITRLAMAHTLASPYTSFVAVDTTPARAADVPLARESIPTLLPKGSQAGMLRYPQTATLAPLLTAVGLVGLMFSLAIALLRRRAVA